MDQVDTAANASVFQGIAAGASFGLATVWFLVVKQVLSVIGINDHLRFYGIIVALLLTFLSFKLFEFLQYQQKKPSDAQGMNYGNLAFLIALGIIALDFLVLGNKKLLSKLRL